MGYDPAVALIKDGKLIAVAEEERFVGIKHAKNFFPINSIKFCLKCSNLDMVDIDFISVGWGAFKYPSYMQNIYRELDKIYKKDKTTKNWEDKTLKEHNHRALINKITRTLNRHGFLTIPKIKFVEHHLSHAASAFYCSGFDEAAVLTVDGHGEENCTVGWYFSKNGNIEKIFEINIPHSLGWYYSAFTEFLGFKHKDGEGKLMGLAPYGSFNKDIFKNINEIITYEDWEYKIDPCYIFYGEHSYNERFTDKMVELLGKPRNSGEEITKKHKDIAYAVQSILEEHLYSIVEHLISETGSDKLCLAGGIALNAKANGYVWSKGIMRNIYIQPLAGDGGTAIGSAFMVYKEMTGISPKFKLIHTYYGPKYSDEEIVKNLKTENVEYRFYDESKLSKIIAEMVTQGKIVGLFHGKMEFGPRALGDRCILADPTRPSMWSRINKIKGRESWRPLASSILEEKTAEFFVNACNSPFMNLCFEVRNEKVQEIPAVVHIDKIARVQTVNKNQNLFFWNIIYNFYEITGIPAILNTSFNKAGEPIACSPLDAINGYKEMMLDGLVINNFLVIR